MKEDLKPCPFCGAEVKIIHNMELLPYGVYCHQCKMIVQWNRLREWGKNETVGEHQAKIAEAWNRRSNP